MSLVPGFDHDLFVSYVRQDDVTRYDSPSGQNIGWITRFADTLLKRVYEILGKNRGEDALWMDHQLRGNENLQDAIHRAVTSSAVLISVLSYKSYLSDWVIKQELNPFCHTETAGFGANIEGDFGCRPRVFKVLIEHIPWEKHPEAIRDTLGYKFYDYDPDTHQSTQYGTSRETEEKYHDALEELAQDVVEVLCTMAAAKGEILSRSHESNRKIVFLSQVPDTIESKSARDLADMRRQIKSALRQYNVLVLPDSRLPAEPEEQMDVLTKILKKADFGIHLVGSEAGPRLPEIAGAASFLPERQFQAALDHGLNAGLANGVAANTPASKLQLFWMPAGLNVADIQEAEHRSFVQRLQTMDSLPEGMKPLPSGEEAAKTEIEQLAKPAKPKKPATIFISHTAEDLAGAEEVAEFLKSRNFRPIRLKDTSLNSTFKPQLNVCQGVVLYYGRAKDAWVSNRVNFFLQCRDNPDAITNPRVKKWLQVKTCIFIEPPVPKGFDIKDDDWRKTRQMTDLLDWFGRE